MLKEIILNENQLMYFEVELFKLNHIESIQLKTGCTDIVYNSKSPGSISKLSFEQKIAELCYLPKPSDCESDEDEMLRIQIAHRNSIESRFCPE